MARVRTTRQERPADRGQLLLLSGLGLAALLVVLALVLNTAIYTENEAARETAAVDVSDLQRAQHDAIGVAERAIAAENEGGHRTYATMQTNLSRHVTVWSELSATHGAQTARIVALELVSVRNGTRIVQDADQTFENAFGSGNWTVVDGATDVGTFSMTVDRSSLVAPSATNNETVLTEQRVFAIAVDDGTPRRVFVYRVGGRTVTAVTDAGGDVVGTCQAAGPTATLDLVNGTLGGSSCPPLGPFLDLSGPARIEFENGNKAAGIYELVVDAPAIDDDVIAPGFGSGSPRAERLLYDATLSFAVSNQNLEYEAVIDGVGGDSR
jgi:hypothetical protein